MVTPGRGPSALWSGLVIMAVAFGLSQSFRTLPSVMVDGLTRDLGVGTGGIGMMAATFHIAFAALQLPIGVLLDRFGVREVMVLAYALAIAGTIACAAAPSFPVLLAGQALIGAGTAPTLMAALVHISRHAPADRFARYSGIVMSLGSLGILISSTPSALLIDISSWRMVFVAHLPVLALCLLLTLRFIAPARQATQPTDRPPAGAGEARGGLWQDFRSLAHLPYRHLMGLFAIGFVAYGAIITFRAIWIVPFTRERYGLTLVEASYLALILSIAMAVTPALTGGLATTTRSISRFIVVTALILTTTLGGLALQPVTGLAAGVVLIAALGLVAASPIAQFAYIRQTVPAALTGRALALLNMVMFVGAALLQWLSGIAAELVGPAGDAYAAAIGFLAVAAGIGTLGFVLLPRATDSAAARQTGR